VVVIFVLFKFREHHYWRPANFCHASQVGGMFASGIQGPLLQIAGQMNEGSSRERFSVMTLTMRILFHTIICQCETYFTLSKAM
jgi:hypothetical protein